MVKHGFYNFLNWFDERAWYPLGRIVGGTVSVCGTDCGMISVNVDETYGAVHEHFALPCVAHMMD